MDNSVILQINNALDTLITGICGVGLVVMILRYTFLRIKEEGFGRGIYLGALATLEGLIFVLAVYFFPQWLAITIGHPEYSATIRWVMLYLTLPPFWYFSIKKISGRRGLIAVLVILTTLLLGWFYDRWIGIAFVAIPILWLFYFVTNKLAQVALPISNPDDKAEHKQKRKAFLSYHLGMQYPFWVPQGKASRDFEVRVKGNYANPWGKPGVVFPWSHQAVGLSLGIQFTKVNGPEPIFTNQFEYPASLVDLRTQLRVSQIEAVTKDGIKVPAVVFMAFAIDRDLWPKKDWDPDIAEKTNTMNSDTTGLDHTEGSYPYSSRRIRLALRKMGIDEVVKENEKATFHWDEWVVKQIEQTAQQIISTRNLDELWRPRDDEPGKSALDSMAAEIKEILVSQLVEVGINLFTARVVNFAFDEKNEEDQRIIKQHIETWRSKWDQRIVQAQADAEAIYREEIENAHAFAKSVLLDAIAESLVAARRVNPDLPRHVIAQYYIYALEEFIKKQPGVDEKDAIERIETLKRYLFRRSMRYERDPETRRDVAKFEREADDD